MGLRKPEPARPISSTLKLCINNSDAYLRKLKVGPARRITPPRLYVIARLYGQVADFMGKNDFVGKAARNGFAHKLLLVHKLRKMGPGVHIFVPAPQAFLSACP